MTLVVTNDDGVGAPGIHALAAGLRALGHEVVVVAPEHDMSGSSAAIGRIELGAPTTLRAVELPAPATGIPAYAVSGPPGLAALIAARQGIGGIEPSLLVSGINAGTNTGHSILHSGTVGASLTAASFGLSGLALSAEWADPMPWKHVVALLPDVLELIRDAPRATVLNVNVPAPGPGGAVRGLRWATLDRFGSFRVAVAERREAAVQLEYSATGHELDPSSDTALVEAGYATVTAIEGIHAIPPDELALHAPPPEATAQLTETPDRSPSRGRG